MDTHHANKRLSARGWLPLLAALSASFAPSLTAAQAPVTVQGRVIEREGRAAVAGATVQLAGLAPVLSGAAGEFSIIGVMPGRYVLGVQAIGYATVDLTLIVRADTTVLIALERAPVPLDTLAVRTRNITVRGEVKDRAAGVGLIDVDVVATPGRRLKTDPIGRFKLTRVPVRVPISIRVEELGYLPQVVTLEPEGDTTVVFELEPDRVAAAMIAAQLRRIDERSANLRYEPQALIDRSQLMGDLNGYLIDVLRRVLGSARLERVSCIIVDERRGGSLQSMSLETLLPDRVERIEILWWGTPRDSLMLRIYTRDYVQDLLRGRRQLVPRERLVTGAHVRDCR